MRLLPLFSTAAAAAVVFAQAPGAVRPPNTTSAARPGGVAAAAVEAARAEPVAEQTPPARPATAPEKPAAPKAPAPKPAEAKAPQAAKMNVAALLNPKGLTAKAPDAYKVKFTTTKGEFVVQVTRAWSPLGADRFWNLVRNGFYNDSTFFRVLPGFVAQFGLSANPSVNAAWRNANIPDDPAAVQSNKRGTLSFATAGPNTRTTQIFINYGDNARLDTMGFTAFGVVLDNGMEIVDQIYSGYGERPNQGRITAEGKKYTDAEFPMLDRILATEVIDPPPPAAPKPAAAKKPLTSAPAPAPVKKSAAPAKP